MGMSTSVQSQLIMMATVLSLTLGRIPSSVYKVVITLYRQAILLNVHFIFSVNPPTVDHQQLILHSYPEPGNFSYVELVCVVNDSSQSSSVVSEARFQLNGTDIEEDDEIVATLGNGTILLLLTQEKEGFFTCSHNMSTSANSVGLAGMSIVVVDENDMIPLL